MENKRGNEIFLGVVGVATLLVAIIGATFAYFSASAVSNNDAIKVQSANLSLGFAEDPSKLSTDLIPASDRIALFAGTDEDWVAGNTFEYTYESPVFDEDGEPVMDGDKQKTETKTASAKGQGLCKDESKNDVCGIYTFTVGNPNFTTAMNIEATLISTTNEFKNIWFAIYDENNQQVFAPTKFPESTKSISLNSRSADEVGLQQQLVGSALDAENNSFNPKDPTTYTRVDKNGQAITDSKIKVAANRRTYKMVIWVQETGGDQTEHDSGKILTAAIRIETESGAGVTGVIAAADGTKKTTPAT